MNIEDELARMFNAELAKTPKPDAPDVIDCTGVTICNDDIVCERGEGLQPDGADTRPIYPKPEDLPHV